MIDFNIIRSFSSIGDQCQLTDSLGRIIKGEIVFLNENTIVVEDEQKNKVFVSGSTIQNFDLINASSKTNPPSEPKQTNTTTTHKDFSKDESIITGVQPKIASNIIDPLPQTNKQSSKKILKQFLPANGTIQVLRKGEGYIYDFATQKIISFERTSLLKIGKKCAK